MEALMELVVAKYRELELIQHLYFRRPDGTVFGKLPTIPEKQVQAYKKAGCVRCNRDGSDLKPGPKPKESN